MATMELPQILSQQMHQQFRERNISGAAVYDQRDFSYCCIRIQIQINTMEIKDYIKKCVGKSLLIDSNYQ